MVVFAVVFVFVVAEVVFVVVFAVVFVGGAEAIRFTFGITADAKA